MPLAVYRPMWSMVEAFLTGFISQEIAQRNAVFSAQVDDNDPEQGLARQSAEIGLHRRVVFGRQVEPYHRRRAGSWPRPIRANGAPRWTAPRAPGERARMENLIAEYLSHLRVERGSSPRTVSAYELDLADYAVFLGEHGLTEAGDVRREDVVAYESSLVDRGYAPSSVKRRVSVVKGFHRFLVREGYVGKNPTDALALPKVPEALPDVLSVAQMDALLSAPHDRTPRALRDQAILEVLYGCGLRASEAVGLDLG